MANDIPVHVANFMATILAIIVSNIDITYYAYLYINICMNYSTLSGLLFIDRSFQ